LLISFVPLLSSPAREVQHIYWVDSKGDDGTIQRANRDESNVEDVLTPEHDTFGIAVDAVGGRIY
jgi:hypothetical protein